LHPQGLNTLITTKKTAKKHYNRNIYISQEDTQSNTGTFCSINATRHRQMREFDLLAWRSA